MQSIQTGHFFSLNAVKPLNRLLDYRKFCMEATKEVLKGDLISRTHSPVDGSLMQPWHKIGPFEYRCCTGSGSLFLTQMPRSQPWEVLLKEVCCYRNTPGAFHNDIVAQREESVFQPKLHWIQNTVRLQGMHRPNVLEVTSVPSPLVSLLTKSTAFGEVASVSEYDLIIKKNGYRGIDVMVLLEALDRSADPSALVRAAMDVLASGGLLFVTALVASGFDMKTLGKENFYLYPPDRANCFSLQDLEKIVTSAGFQITEVSTPGLLDVEIVRAHLAQNPSLSLSDFERSVLEAPRETHAAFQNFLQQSNMSSFARLAARKKN